jgi:hypothetical protein
MVIVLTTEPVAWLPQSTRVQTKLSFYGTYTKSGAKFEVCVYVVKALSDKKKLGLQKKFFLCIIQLRILAIQPGQHYFSITWLFADAGDEQLADSTYLCNQVTGKAKQCTYQQL